MSSHDQRDQPLFEVLVNEEAQHACANTAATQDTRAARLVQRTH
jgi:hypothetical protein